MRICDRGIFRIDSPHITSSNISGLPSPYHYEAVSTRFIPLHQQYVLKRFGKFLRELDACFSAFRILISVICYENGNGPIAQSQTRIKILLRSPFSQSSPIHFGSSEVRGTAVENTR